MKCSVFIEMKEQLFVIGFFFRGGGMYSDKVHPDVCDTCEKEQTFPSSSEPRRPPGDPQRSILKRGRTEGSVDTERHPSSPTGATPPKALSYIPVIS